MEKHGALDRFSINKSPRTLVNVCFGADDNVDALRELHILSGVSATSFSQRGARVVERMRQHTIDSVRGHQVTREKEPNDAFEFRRSRHGSSRVKVKFA